MKKITLILLVSIIMLCSCTVNQNENKNEATPNGKTVNYVCPMRENYIVEYSVDGETARLYAESNKIYELEKALSVMDEEYYKNSENVAIHESNGNLSVELEKDKTTKCEEFKG